MSEKSSDFDGYLDDFEEYLPPDVTILSADVLCEESFAASRRHEITTGYENQKAAVSTERKRRSQVTLSIQSFDDLLPGKAFEIHGMPQNVWCSSTEQAAKSSERIPLLLEWSEASRDISKFPSLHVSEKSIACLGFMEKEPLMIYVAYREIQIDDVSSSKKCTGGVLFFNTANWKVESLLRSPRPLTCCTNSGNWLFGGMDDGRICSWWVELASSRLVCNPSVIVTYGWPMGDLSSIRPLSSGTQDDQDKLTILVLDSSGDLRTFDFSANASKTELEDVCRYETVPSRKAIQGCNCLDTCGKRILYTQHGELCFSQIDLLYRQRTNTSQQGGYLLKPGKPAVLYMKLVDDKSALCGCSNGSLAHYLLTSGAICIQEWHHVTNGHITHIEINPEDRKRFIAIDTLSQMHIGQIDNRASGSIRSSTLTKDGAFVTHLHLLLIDSVPALLLGYSDGTAELQHWTALVAND